MVKIIIPSVFGFNLSSNKLVKTLNRGPIVAGIIFLATFCFPQLGWSVVLPSYSVTLSWDPSPSPETVGYRVYYGTVSRLYSHSVTTPTTTVTITGLTGGITYFFAVTSFDANGVESVFSEEITYTPGGGSTKSVVVTIIGKSSLKIQGPSGRTYKIEATEDLIRWSAIGSVTLDSAGSMVFNDTNAVNVPRRFYRTRDAQL